MSIELGRRLIAANLVTREKVQAALLLSVVRGIPFTRALVDRGAISEAELDEEIARYVGPGLRHVQGSQELVQKLPRAMCRRLCALPTRLDPFTGTVDVAAADPLDPHVEAEMSFHLGAPVRVIRAPIGAVEEAIRRIELEAAQPAPPKKHRSRRVTPAAPFGAPQSSIPPPAMGSAPIPLVRRVGEPDAEPGAKAARNPTTRRGTPATMGGADLAKRAGAFAPRPEEPPRVSFPSTPPPGPPSASADLAFAPAESSAWRGATYGRPALDPALFSRAPTSDTGIAPHVVEAPTDDAAQARSAMWTTYEGPTAEAVSAVFAASPVAIPAGPSTLASAPNAGANAVVVPPRGPTLPPPTMDSARDHAHDFGEHDEEPQRTTIAGPPPLPFPDPTAILAALARANARDEIVMLALGGASLFANRVALFAVKRDGYHGWTCNEAFGDEEALRAVSVPLEAPSIFATASATSIYLGPIPPTPAHAALLAVMEGATNDVAALAVRVAGRPAAVIVVDELGDTLTGTRRLDELGRAVGEALARLLAARS